MLGILLGNQWIRDSPRNFQGGVVPENSTLIGWIIEIAAFIKELDRLAERGKSVSKSGGDVDLILLFSRKDQTRPLSKCGGTNADIQRYVIGLAFDDPTKLRLWMA